MRLGYDLEQGYLFSAGLFIYNFNELLFSSQTIMIIIFITELKYH